LTNLTQQLALTDEETLNEVVDCLAKYIPLKAKGACSPATLFQIVVRAATTHDTIENTAKQLQGVTSSNNIRYHLGKLNDFVALEKQFIDPALKGGEFIQALKSQIPKGLSLKKQSLAIDFNLIPYYGQPSELEAPFIYRSKAKLGTCSFYASATLYVIPRP